MLSDLLYDYVPRFMTVTCFIHPDTEEIIEIDELKPGKEYAAFESRFFNQFSFPIFIKTEYVGDVYVTKESI